MTTFYTIGHSTREIDEFLFLLTLNRIDCLVDVRSYPSSRRCPQFNKDALAASLEAHGLQYRHMLSLGGRRGKSKTVEPETNALWEHPAFHNYADYTLTQEFADGLEELRRLGEQMRVAYMCSESVWWKCHRRIITDYLLASGEEVIHILSSNKNEDARMTKGSGCCGGKPTYKSITPLLL